MSIFLFVPRGLLDPVWCRKIKCTSDKARTTNGRRKCKVKNRVNVALSTANPPHSHWTIVVPRYGIADRRFVITVAPQKDIWPHGRTYPRNAVPIVANRMITPTVHVSWYIKDP